MADPILVAFGNHIRALRNERGLSQEELGAQADLDRTYISGIERGTRNIGLINIFRVAEALDQPPSELLNFEVE